MRVKNYYSNQAEQIYKVNHDDYEHIKDWIDKCKSNYYPPQILSPNFQYFPLNYVFSFRKITLQQNFISKYARQFNSIASNGMCILAGIYDENENVYIAKPYEKKRIFCKTNAISKTIQLLEQMTIAFYSLDERVPSKSAGYRDVSLGSKIKKMCVVINFEFILNDGEIFSIGSIKYSLSNRPKIIRTDLQIIKIAEKSKVAYMQIQIDTPDKLGLSYFLPANCIIDHEVKVPPCKTIDLKNKSVPYTMLPMNQIRLEELQLTINNFDKLFICLKRCSPYFTEYHHENITMQIIKMNLNVGFHNSWIMINDLPGFNYKQKQPQTKPITSKNLSKLTNSIIQAKQNKKQMSKALIYYPIRLTAVAGNENEANAKTIILKSQQQTGMKSSSFLQVSQIKDALDLIHFEVQGGQIMAVLQFTVKFTIDAVIKQQKTLKFNIFWVPITFDKTQCFSQINIPLIAHIDMPGYPIQWNRLNINSTEVFGELKYKCFNDNPQMHKNIRKERVKTYKSTNYGGRTKTQYEDDSSYYDRLLEQLQSKGKQEDNQTLKSKNMLKSYKQFRITTQHNVKDKNEEVDQTIIKLMKRLQKTQRPRLKLIASSFNASIQRILPQIQTNLQLDSSKLIGKSYQLRIRLREYLPLTDNYDQYYIPRKMLIKLYGFRNIHEQTVLINKDSAKAGIPLQLQNPRKQDYKGFSFNFKVDKISEEDLKSYQNGHNFIATVYDQQNMLYFACGQYPSLSLFNLPRRETHQKNKTLQNKEQNEQSQSLKHFRIQLKSKSLSGQYHIRGYFLFEYKSVQVSQNQINRVKKGELVEMSKIIKQIPLKDRQKLRIQNYTGNQDAQNTKRQLIDKYRKNGHYRFVNELTRKQYNNDLQIDYEIGKPTFSWLKINNTDKSENNVFTFTFDCDFIQFVTDKALYQKNALASAKKQDDGAWKNQPNLAYILGKQGHNGRYQTKILSGTQCDFLIKVLNNQWSQSMPQVAIVNLQVKRNTLPFKTYKIKLSLKAPLIDKIYHVYAMWELRSDAFKFRLPQQIPQQYGQNIFTLTPSTLYDTKSKMLILNKINQQNIPDSGSTVLILVGIYSDKKLQQLLHTLLLQVQCVQGENLKMSLGDLETVRIPLTSQLLDAKQRIFRVQLSNDTYQVRQKASSKLKYCSHIEKNQPQLLLKCLRPIREELIVTIINLQGKLIKKYAIQLECRIPERCEQQLIQIQGYINQKVIFVVNNNYHIDFEFYLSSSNSSFIFSNLYESKEQKLGQLFNIKGKSQIRMKMDIINEIKQQQFVVLSDSQHRVIRLYKLKIKQKVANTMGKWLTNSFMQNFGPNTK